MVFQNLKRVWCPCSFSLRDTLIIESKTPFSSLPPPLFCRIQISFFTPLFTIPSKKSSTHREKKTESRSAVREQEGKVTIDSEPFVGVDVFGELDDGFEVSLDDGVVAIGLAKEKRADGRDGSLWLNPAAQFAMVGCIRLCMKEVIGGKNGG